MDGNNKSVAGYLVPFAISPEQIIEICQSENLSVLFVGDHERPTYVLERIIARLGRPVYRVGNVETVACIRSVGGAPDCRMLNTAMLPEGEWTDVVRRSDLHKARASDAATIREMGRQHDKLSRAVTRLTDALSHIRDAPPSIYDARNFRVIARAALREGEE